MVDRSREWSQGVQGQEPCPLALPASRTRRRCHLIPAATDGRAAAAETDLLRPPLSNGGLTSPRLIIRYLWALPPQAFTFKLTLSQTLRASAATAAVPCADVQFLISDNAKSLQLTCPGSADNKIVSLGLVHYSVSEAAMFVACGNPCPSL